MFLPTLFKKVDLPKQKHLSKPWGYDINISDSDADAKQWRTKLGVDLGNPLIVIGLNPGIADI